MNIKEFTESAIAAYLKSGGKVNPDVTLHLFQFIESDEELLREYNALKSHYKEVNPRIGQTVREYFDLRNDKKISVSGKCILLTSYTRFHKKI
ncbi:MAG: hypothetical protein IJ200_02420 [Prevotella sp.]|nr:hypothetical protein [Prevotella sp.]